MSKKTRPRVIPVMIGGIQSTVPFGSIKDWTRAHGKTHDGTQVNSPSYTKVGDSVIFQSDTGHTLSLPKADAEVLCARILSEIGYGLTAPASV